MRHAVSGNRLGRNSSWRKATVRDIARATLTRQRISTTKAKAKEAVKLIDRLITLGKKGALAHRRRAFAILGDHSQVSELFSKTALRFHKRNGGYTRIIPLSRRRGDNARLVYLELTEKAEVIISKPKSSAAAKAGKLDVIPGKEKKIKESLPISSGEVQEIKEEKKPVSQKSQQPKPSVKKQEDHIDTLPGGGKGKLGKKFVGGIKKIFRRKTI